MLILDLKSGLTLITLVEIDMITTAAMAPVTPTKGIKEEERTIVVDIRSLWLMNSDVTFLPQKNRNLLNKWILVFLKCT